MEPFNTPSFNCCLVYFAAVLLVARLRLACFQQRCEKLLVCGCVGGGALWACRLSGLDIIVVWATVDIGVVKWTRCWMHRWLDGLFGESTILGLSMIGIAG